MTITSGIQATGVVTMAMEVLHNTCNMCICDLPDMYALIPQACSPWSSGIHIRQIPHAHVTTITYHTAKRAVLLYCTLEWADFSLTFQSMQYGIYALMLGVKVVYIEILSSLLAPLVCGIVDSWEDFIQTAPCILKN